MGILKRLEVKGKDMDTSVKEQLKIKGSSTAENN
jgi:hypothetical protein